MLDNQAARESRTIVAGSVITPPLPTCSISPGLQRPNSGTASTLSRPYSLPPRSKTEISPVRPRRAARAASTFEPPSVDARSATAAL
jgi:hypothetical protein